MERLGQYAWAESPGTRPTVRVCTEVLTLSEPLPQLLDADTTYTSDPLPTGTQLPTSVKEKTRFWYKGLPALPSPDQANLLHSWCPGPHGPVEVAACLLPLGNSRGQYAPYSVSPSTQHRASGAGAQGILRMLWVLSVLATSQHIFRSPWCACCSSTPTSMGSNFLSSPFDHRERSLNS